jgi:hypothetical protein
MDIEKISQVIEKEFNVIITSQKMKNNWYRFFIKKDYFNLGRVSFNSDNKKLFCKKYSMYNDINIYSIGQRIQQLFDQLNSIQEFNIDVTFDDQDNKIQALKNTIKLINIRLSNLEKKHEEAVAPKETEQMVSQIYSRHGQPWISNEENMLSEKYDKFISHMSYLCGRSPGAIRVKIRRLNLNKDFNR